MLYITSLHFLCLYRPPPNRRYNLTVSMFTEQLLELDYIDNLPGFACLVGDMNIHFDNPLQSLTKQTLTTIGLHSLVQTLISPLTGAVIQLTGLLLNLTMTSMTKLLLQTLLYHNIKYYFNLSVSMPSTLCSTVGNMANIDRPSISARLSSDSEFSSVEKANQYCYFLRTVHDRHAHPSQRKAINHN